MFKDSDNDMARGSENTDDEPPKCMQFVPLCVSFLFFGSLISFKDALNHNNLCIISVLD